MRYITTVPISLKTSSGIIELKPGDSFKTNNPDSELIKSMVSTGKLISFYSWLDRLSDSEREIFKERAAIIEFDGDYERERAEVEAIKQIIRERIIPGKCDICNSVNECMLTKGQREYCNGPLNKDLVKQ